MPIEKEAAAPTAATNEMRPDISKSNPPLTIPAPPNAAHANIKVTLPDGANHPMLAPLREHRQFIVYALIPRIGQTHKMDKIPINPDMLTLDNYQDPKKLPKISAHLPQNWMTAEEAINKANWLCFLYGDNYGVGFALTKDDPFVCIDLDNCVSPDGSISECAQKILARFPGAGVELSVSGGGLHIWMRIKAPLPPTRRKSGVELYPSRQFIALTGRGAFGDAGKDCTEELVLFRADYFKPEKTKQTQIPSPPVCSDADYLERIEHLRSALLYVTALTDEKGHMLNLADDRHIWTNMGHALCKLGEDGYRLWAEWSATSHKHNGDKDLARWNTFKGDRTDYRAVFALAQQHGWSNPLRWVMPDPAKIFGANRLPTELPVQPATNTQSLKPTPLPELPSVLPFDYSHLPEEVRDFVYDISNRMQGPPDFVAVGTYVMLSAVIGRKIGIRPKKHDDWTVTPNLWAAAIGHSGVKKSPSLKESQVPLRKLEARAIDVFNIQMSEYDAQCELAQINQAVNKSEAKKAVRKKDLTEASNLLKLNQICNKPILKRYITNDASYEALGELMIENPNGVMLFSDELIGLLKRLDTPGQESARAFFLTMADGNQSYTFDRITRGKNLHIKVVCASILGGIQPGVLSEYVRLATDGGAGADGLLQRFGLMVYPDISPNYEPIDRAPNILARAKVDQLIDKLDRLNPANIGAESDGYGGMPFLRLDEEAQVLFSEWDTALQRRLRSGEEHPAIVSHLSKYPKLILSITLLNHLCDSKQGAVSKIALERAIAYGAYLESHAHRVYSFATRPEIEAAKTLLKRLASRKLLTPFTAREVSQKGWAGLSTSAKTYAAINILLEYGHLSEEEKRDTVGRPTKLYHWQKEE